MADSDFLAGTLRVLILAELSRGASYGYAIAQAIDAQTGGELTVRPESLYPVLHRMEQGKLVAARWEHTGTRPRKMYTVTAKGRKQWDKTRETFVRVMGGALRAVEGGADTLVGQSRADKSVRATKGGPSYEPAR